ncbi:hypothetical protein F383_28166 [Gossypium arboreum]|uniref:Uncharacterized protein n=1 Tax=Gossypium arboreum TaxID=29729 RepID=A0A0B0P3I8_GOSAR|nr:hypothetical protein F383_28166 [Gossypium arboreum]
MEIEGISSVLTMNPASEMDQSASLINSLPPTSCARSKCLLRCLNRL